MTKYIYKNTDGSFSTAHVIQVVDANGNTVDVTASAPLPVSATFSGSVDVSQKSTAAVPSYTEGTDNEMSGTLTGGLRVQAQDGAGNDVSSSHPLPVSVASVPGNVTVVQPTGTNLHAVLDSTSTTAVTQATAANLNATVVGTGTFAVQNTAATPAGANVIGHVINDASSAVIGHVIADSGSTTAVTGNVTVVQGTGTNLHAVLDSGSTTAVTQATATNLNAAVVGTGTSTTAAGGSLSVNPDSIVDGTTSTASVTSATTILTFSNTAGYGYIAFGLTSVGTSNTIVVDQAADGASYNAAATFWRVDAASSVSPAVSIASPTTAMQFVVPVTAQAMRIRVSVYGSGTVTAYASLKRGAPPAAYTLSQIGNNVSVVGNVASGSADSAAPVKIGAKYNASPPTFSDGNRGDMQIDAHGSHKIALYDANGNAIDPTLASQIYFSNSYVNITSKTTTTVKSGAGRIQGIQVNTLGTADTLTVYDNTAGSGTKIATIASPLLGSNFCVGAAFGTGLTIVTGGTTAGDYTVYYT